ncbi:GABA permease domain protein [Janthinobacterium agaricidamnosum NBRC 102515 = DSM 9628]|uniref:GABA permease domain protein n=1 Tax=Janthinobacterium agaricidamnosum NBRC 102515 = DSM 9628 TaxID=1349767 RepID=W0VDC4_9BURK|nr:GABA permease domain protein [Janthinobacterium agaricidamnosum NBRC 102515 = DSM 9628]
MSAAEADDPGKSIPAATNQVVHRILPFYIGSAGILLALHPWHMLATNGSSHQFQRRLKNRPARLMARDGTIVSRLFVGICQALRRSDCRYCRAICFWRCLE